MLFVFCAPAQEDWLAKYPFLNLEKNKLEFTGDSDRFMAFYQKLDTLIFKGKGQINIVHMGGSHVQAGTLSGRMRKNWLHLSPGLQHDRGFFFPYTLAKTNNPSDYNVNFDGFWEGCRCALPSANCYWGVSGINASTVDTNASVTITASDENFAAYSFNRVRVFYAFSDTSFVPFPNMPDNPFRAFADSAGQYMEFTFEKPATTLSLRFRPVNANQKGFTLQGIQYVSKQPGLTYHAIGVNGAATYSYLRCANFTNQMVSLKPDLVIFGIGINDAHRPENEFSQSTYERNYDSLVAMIRGVNPNAVFIFMTNNDSFYKGRYSNPNIVKVQAAMKNLAAKNESAYWDLFEIMGGYNSIRAWERYGLAKKDKIHFTPEGYLLNADLLFEAIKQSYGVYLNNQYQQQD
jgi:lysophospholipase L1-like esterase